jgi:hypothetical protein
LISGAKSTLARGQADIERVRRWTLHDPPSSGMLAIVTASTGTAVPYQFLYNWSEAELISASPYTVAAKSLGVQGTAVSMSELGNGAGRVAYGVTVANIPAGFAPAPIPAGTPVWIVPWRQNNGTLLWLILNTQAIDGACPP